MAFPGIHQLRSLCLALLMGSFALEASAQNLVPNPGFEECFDLPVSSAEFKKVKEWFNPAGDVPAVSDFGTPDFFHTSGGGPARLPETRMGDVSAYRGKAIAGLILFNKYDEGLINFREYLCVKLKEPLQVGIPYQVEFHFSTGSGNHYGKYVTPNLQLSFTGEKPMQNGNKPLILEPHYSTPGIKANSGWERIAFEFTPDQPYQYLTIGNFLSDQNTPLETEHTGKRAGPCAYYFIDEVSVMGKGALSLACPDDQLLATDLNQCDKLVKYELPEMEGPKGSELELVEGQESGARFQRGETVVLYRATSPAGAVAECDFRIEVVDQEPPVINCPENMVVPPAPNARRTPVDYPDATATDNCGEVRARRIEGPTGEAGFLPGTTTVTFRAVDRSNNGSDCSFTVTVEEERAVVVEDGPEETAEEEQSVAKDIPSAGEEADKPEPTEIVKIEKAHDPEEVPEIVEIGEPEDLSPPTIPEVPLRIKCPRNISVNTHPGSCEKAVSYPKPEWSGPEGTKFGRVSGGASREKFSKGEHIIHYRVQSPSGEEQECRFTITVSDKEYPRMKCPEDIKVKAGPGEKSARVEYPVVTATDNCGQVNMRLVKGLESGEAFPVGETLVTYEAADEEGHLSECSFKVRVDGLPEKIGDEAVAFQQEIISSSSESITIYFYDAQVKDNDIISINVDGEWVLQESKIKKKKNDFWKTDNISVTLEPDQLHYMVFQANDEGSIPPCTISLMIVDDARNLIAERTVSFKIGESGGVVFKLK